MDRQEFGHYIKGLRNKRGLTQAEVAEGLGLKYSQSIANIESGRVNFPQKHAADFCKLMEIDQDKFIDLMTKVYKSDLSSKLRSKNQKRTA